MSNYETVLILNPVLSEDQVKESIDKFNGGKGMYGITDICLASVKP